MNAGVTLSDDLLEPGHVFLEQKLDRRGVPAVVEVVELFGAAQCQLPDLSRS